MWLRMRSDFSLLSMLRELVFLFILGGHLLARHSSLIWHTFKWIPSSSMWKIIKWDTQMRDSSERFKWKIVKWETQMKSSSSERILKWKIQDPKILMWKRKILMSKIRRMMIHRESRIKQSNHRRCSKNVIRDELTSVYCRSRAFVSQKSHF